MVLQPMVKFQLNGLKSAIDGMGARKALVPIIMADISRGMGDAYIKHIKMHVKEQDYNFPALSIKYRMRKRRNKEKWWIHEGSFLKRLESRPTKSSVVAGAFADVPYARGLSMLDVATILEQGAPEFGIASRPLFKRSKADFPKTTVYKELLAGAAASIASGKRRRR